MLTGALVFDAVVELPRLRLTPNPNPELDLPAPD